jgi:hypothetical protein
MQLQTADVMSPQEFDRYWDEPTKTVASKKKQNEKKP